MLFLWDQARRMRLKIWVTGEVHHPDEKPDLAATTIEPDYRGKVERLIEFTVQAYDWNCPQHITPRFTEEEFMRQSPTTLACEHL